MTPRELAKRLKRGEKWELDKKHDVSASVSNDLLCCPCCESKLVGIERDSNIFTGQVYSDRYPSNVANQNHGFRAKCGNCGLQTCWWHYEREAVTFWNVRPI